jgi:hypothetical protein
VGNEENRYLVPDPNKIMVLLMNLVMPSKNPSKRKCHMFSLICGL